MRKKIEEARNKWKLAPRSWISRINIVEINILTKVMYRLNPHQNSNDIFFRGIEKKSLQNHVKPQKTLSSESKQNKNSRYHTSQFQLYYKSMVLA